MSHTKVQPGAYRALFIDALNLYRKTAQEAELPVIDHYLRLLADQAYKFGNVQYGGGHTDFFRS